MGKAQRDKGKRGERAWRDLLRDFGFHTAYRTQQFSGKCPEGSADVNCPQLPSLHFEVKNVEKLSIWPAMTQASIDAPAGKIPVVAHTKNLHGFLVTLAGEDFLNLVRRSDLVTEAKPSQLKLEREAVK